MKKITLLIATLAFSAFAQAAFPIEGNWAAPQQQDNGFQFEGYFSFANNTLTLTNVCRYQGSVASASVTVPALYDISTLTISNSAQNEQKSPDGKLNCNVSVVPMRLTYQVQGHLLILTQPGSADQFVLRRQ
jgi:hypothetical protein